MAENEEQERMTSMNLLALQTANANIAAFRKTCAGLLLSCKGQSSIIASASGDKLLLFHPKFKQESDIPELLLMKLSGRWTTHQIHVSIADKRRMSIVQFFSKSKPSPSFDPTLPDTWARILSNFHLEIIEIDGKSYPSGEHYFQAMKAISSSQPSMADWFTCGYNGPNKVPSNPKVAKSKGTKRAYRNFNAELDIDNWNQRRISCMRSLIDARWSQQPIFKQCIMSTVATTLLHFERSGKNSFWGGSIDKITGEINGENMLGRMMMDLRDNLLS